MVFLDNIPQRWRRAFCHSSRHHAIYPHLPEYFAQKKFVINFLSSKYDAHCRKLTVNGGEDIDEPEAAGLTHEACTKICTPRIKEVFLSFECKLTSVIDLSGKGMNALIIGRVLNAAMDENHHNIASICENFSYNIRAMASDGDTNSFAMLQAYE